MVLDLACIPEEVWEHWAQGVCNAQHDLCEAAGQHTQQVAILRLVLVHAAKVMVKASLDAQQAEHKAGKTRLSVVRGRWAQRMAEYSTAEWYTTHDV
jgi:hypothetical protein